ncbi:phage portal protein [Aureliella helgolandensis]|uniref:Phage portal protein n=1 Tax=Aureliella helgolandensis TaxID=2527968 RepID=A0A518GDR8_9BACT|nr:phage portal protein [Aureliella helgolandensis]QDV26732.1 Phage portal protein [Aureliella helgolandensis]
MADLHQLANQMIVMADTSSADTRASDSLENPANPINAETLAALDFSTVGTNAGEKVTKRSALSIPAVYQAVSMISGDVAKLPMGTWRRLASGGRTLDRKHHAFRYVNLVGRPNEEVNAFKFWRRLMVSALLWNNGYAWIDKNGRGEVLGLYNLLPDRTTPYRHRGKLRFMTEVAGRLVSLEADEVFHIEGLSLDGLHGEDLVGLFRETFGQALAKSKFKSKFFANGMMAGGVLAVPPGAKPTTVTKLQGAIKEKFSNTDNAFKTLVLRDGYKWFSTQVDPQKAQLTESEEQDARQVARMFNLKAGRLSVEGATSYNADEMAIRDYHDGTLSHWLIGLRCEANAKLRTPEEIDADEVFLDYNINALMWADAKTRSDIANTGIQHGRWSPNETRDWENLNPYEGGDIHYRPLNLEPIDGKPTEEDARQAAAEKLARGAIDRANNRLGIKLQRAKTPEARAAIWTDEEPTIREMIGPACEVLELDIESQLEQLGELTK